MKYVSTLTPDPDNQGNRWSYGPSGTAVRAIGMVYELDPDVLLLDQMIRFCDAELSVRNDLAAAPVGQRKIWTGHVDPVWPNHFGAEPVATGGEQGDAVGNLAYCAKLILLTPTVWNRVVPDGDSHLYGRTYLARAKSYLREGDRAVDDHILKSLLDLSHHGHQYFAADSPYKGGTPVPWNQQMMFDYAFENLASAHRILKDDPARAGRYHDIVADSLTWFFTEGVQTGKAKSGGPVYDWAYALPSKNAEDATHAAMDIAGFCSAYATGEYGLTAEKMTPFANMLVDVLMSGPHAFAGRVDGSSGSGHAAATQDLRSGYILSAEFRPDAYLSIVSTDLTEKGTTSKLDLFSRFLWGENAGSKK